MPDPEKKTQPESEPSEPTADPDPKSGDATNGTPQATADDPRPEASGSGCGGPEPPGLGDIGSPKRGEKMCLHFLKKVGSPQKFFSKLKGKKESGKSPKEQSPGATSLREKSPEAMIKFQSLWREYVPEGSALFQTLKYDQIEFGHRKIERIDYANLAEERIIPTFLGTRPCYDAMLVSGKVVILSVDLLVKNAFSALVSNDIKAAPLWDSGILEFVGMLTISDFINVLRHYYKTNQDDIKDIENQSIATWRRITEVKKPFIKINGMDSLAQATKLLIQEEVHRLPVFDEKRQCVLFVLTLKRLLSFLNQHLFENFDKTNVRKPSFFKKGVRELKIGTYENIATIDSATKVISALDLFVERQVSALPVVSEDGCLLDVFEKLDVFALAKDQTYHNLDLMVQDAIGTAQKVLNRGRPMICKPDDSLESVINALVSEMTNPCPSWQYHRMIVVEENKVVGIVSLSDILKFLVVQPLVVMECAVSSASETIQESAEGAAGGSEGEVADVSISEAMSSLKLDDSTNPSSTPEEPPAQTTSE